MERKISIIEGNIKNSIKDRDKITKILNDFQK